MSANTAAEAPQTAPQCLGQVVLESSQRLSSGIALHIFSASTDFLSSFHVSEHIQLQFPEDLDPINGSHSSPSDRLLTFTPCHLQKADLEERQRISILARNGRVSQLLGLPRLNGPLTGDIVEIGGGFEQEVLEDLQRTTCIASGTGIAPFLALACGDAKTTKTHLVCTMNGNDFATIEHLLSSEILVPGNWAFVHIFVTAGEESSGMVAGKSVQWWQERFAQQQQKAGNNVRFSCRRMKREDIDIQISGPDHQVLFCGSKSLEWQVKMWMLGKTPVHTTTVQ